MNYPYMRQGDRLPVVGVLQKLLNVYGANLSVDGQFGQLTHQAVIAYQRRQGLFPDGRVGQQTWNSMTAGFRLPIIDCVDVWDDALYSHEVGDIRRVGGNPILIGGMSNGVEQAVEEIIYAANGRNVFLLRFHGHGSSGVAGVSDGEGEMGGGHGSYIGLDTYADMGPILEPLRDIFGPYGSVQFMHCSTGRGESGRTLLENISDTLGVPATAGTIDQLGGGLDTFKFEGPTYTASPHGQTLGSWSRSRPEFPAVSSL
jgi:hypothetical protein